MFNKNMKVLFEGIQVGPTYIKPVRNDKLSWLKIKHPKLTALLLSINLTERPPSSKHMFTNLGLTFIRILENVSPTNPRKALMATIFLGPLKELRARNTSMGNIVLPIKDEM